MRSWIPGVLAALVLLGVPAATVALHHDEGTAARSASASAPDGTRKVDGGRAEQRAERRAERRSDRREWRAERREHRWERRQERSERVGPDRAAAMARRAQQHAEGMKAWAACVKEAGDDPTKRVDCERPLPPGLAKHR